jgi:hypothetical protein
VPDWTVLLTAVDNCAVVVLAESVMVNDAAALMKCEFAKQAMGVSLIVDGKRE